MRLECCIKLWKIVHWSRGKESLLLEKLICRYCNTSSEARVGREMCSLPQRAWYLPFGSLRWTLVCHLSILNFSKEVWKQDDWASWWGKALCAEERVALNILPLLVLDECWNFTFSPSALRWGFEGQRLEGSTEMRKDWSWMWDRTEVLLLGKHG